MGRGGTEQRRISRLGGAPRAWRHACGGRQAAPQCSPGFAGGTCAPGPVCREIPFCPVLCRRFSAQKSTALGMAVPGTALVVFQAGNGPAHNRLAAAPYLPAVGIIKQRVAKDILAAAAYLSAAVVIVDLAAEKILPAAAHLLAVGVIEHLSPQGIGTGASDLAAMLVIMDGLPKKVCAAGDLFHFLPPLPFPLWGVRDFPNGKYT